MSAAVACHIPLREPEARSGAVTMSAPRFINSNCICAMMSRSVSPGLAAFQAASIAAVVM
jgi:hypothetical protein